MQRFFFILLTVFLFGLPSIASAQDDGRYVEEKENGQIDWTGQYVEATGISIINRDRFSNETQARVMAERGALLVAKANLLEIVEGIHVVRTTTVRDLMTESDVIETRVEGVIRGARKVGQSRIEGDVVEVTVRLPLYDEGVASAVAPPANTPGTPPRQEEATPASDDPEVMEILQELFGRQVAAAASSDTDYEVGDRAQRRSSGGASNSRSDQNAGTGDFVDTGDPIERLILNIGLPQKIKNLHVINKLCW